MEQEIQLKPVFEDFIIKARDGLKLYGWHMRAESPVKGNLIIVHGFKDYSERYVELARKLSHEGFEVYAFDLRGHAKSQGERVYFKNLDIVIDDVRLAVEKFKQNDNGRPWIIFGHSAGGGIVSRFIADHPEGFEGFILSAPLLKRAPDLNVVLEKTVRLVDKFAPHFKMVDLPAKKYSRDPKVVDSLRRDPLIHDIKVPAHTAVLLIDNMDYLSRSLKKIKLPFLVLHSQNDQINNVEGAKDFFSGTPGNPKKQLRIYRELSHDLFHEPEHEEVEADTLNWLKRLVA